MFRLPPAGPPGAYKTYQVLRPAATHWRAASCAEVGCVAHSSGWTTTVPAGGRLEHTVRASGRHWETETVNPDGTVTFEFPPGQACFAAATHRVQVRDDEIYLVRGGDWRGNPAGIEPRRHTRAVDFVDDWATHQQALADRVRRG